MPYQTFRPAAFYCPKILSLFQPNRLETRPINDLEAAAAQALRWNQLAVRQSMIDPIDPTGDADDGAAPGAISPSAGSPPSLVAPVTGSTSATASAWPFPRSRA